MRKSESGQNDHFHQNQKTAVRLSDEYNVSPKTIRRDAQVAEAIDSIGASSPEPKHESTIGTEPTIETEPTQPPTAAPTTTAKPATTAAPTQAPTTTLNGYHTQKYDNGDEYSGNFVNGVRSGQGTYRWANGNVYAGEWKDDNITGHGTYTWADGTVYVGEFDNGVITGQGTYTYPIEIGGVIELGGYEWKVLDIQESKALLLSKDIIELRKYHNVNEPVTWESCDLRRYLNGEFYNSFSSDDRLRIMETRLTNKDNQWYGTSGGNDTNDMIFLLSIEEVVRYFGDSGGLWDAKPDEWRFNDEYGDRRIAYGSVENEWRPWFWWLRSPGFDSSRAAGVHFDGGINLGGDGVSD